MDTKRYPKAIVTIGNLNLDCYQAPSGKYYFSLGGMKSQLKILSGNSTGKKYLIPILQASPESVEYDAPIEGAANATLVELDLVTQIIGDYAERGNKYCFALMKACMSETLERRADLAFGVTRTEEERNRFIIERCCNRLPNPWERRFSDEYYEGLARLTGLEAEGHKRPRLWAKLTNEFVYDELPTGVREKLSEMRDNCDTPAKLHQYLSTFEGLSLFNDRMTTVLVLLRSCTSLEDFREKLHAHKHKTYQRRLF